MSTRRSSNRKRFFKEGFSGNSWNHQGNRCFVGIGLYESSVNLNEENAVYSPFKYISVPECSVAAEITGFGLSEKNSTGFLS